MHRFNAPAAALALAIAAVVTPTAPASARIVCDGNYQIINGQPHGTPYCADNYLAQVARGYGMRVSARAVRNNPGLKAQVCRFIGHDNRVRDTCTNYRNEDGRPGLRF